MRSLKEEQEAAGTDWEGLRWVYEVEGRVFEMPEDERLLFAELGKVRLVVTVYRRWRHHTEDSWHWLKLFGNPGDVIEAISLMEDQ